MVNKNSTSPSISKFLSSQPWWVGGRIKISSFPKRFYQNINYIKFFQKLLSKVGTGIGPYGPSLCARICICCKIRENRSLMHSTGEWLPLSKKVGEWGMGNGEWRRPSEKMGNGDRKFFYPPNIIF